RYRRDAQRRGADDALLMTSDRGVSETTMANIGFFDEAGVVWPDAPMLRGITMQLLDRVLTETGASPRHEVVRTTDGRAFDGAFLSNARGLAVVRAIDDTELLTPEDPLRRLADAYRGVSWDPI